MRSSAGCTTSTSESEFSVHTTIPVASIALILGVDRFMSEARALTNLIGNGVATVVVAKWENALDADRLRRHLDQETELEADLPEKTLPAPAPLVT